MASRMVPRNRGPNLGVTFDLSDFTQRLFAAVGAGVKFAGPGPSDHRWTCVSSARHERFAISYLAEEMFSKFDDKKSSVRKREVAISRFRQGEDLCALTNQKFGLNKAGQLPEWLDEVAQPSDLPEDLRFTAAVVRRAQRIISRILGSFPGWEAVIPLCDFGPGATTRLKREASRKHNKWSGQPHVTPFPSSGLIALFEGLPLLRERWEGPGYQMVAGNKLDWVPKNYKTDRTIAIEPDLNMFLQKGLGGLIRRRLKRVKQDLDTQEVNQFLAGVGSITGELATLDMSMASDTVAYRLVEVLFLLRPDWFAALEQCRSPVGFAKLPEGDVTVIFEKFSSMGNGYTFELESLIFYSLARAVSDLTGESDHRIYVYGDDLVVPTGISTLVMDVLGHCGFLINEDKSFTSGPFRESCGSHYVDGYDVTPFYIREAVDSLDRLFLLHNNVYRWFHRMEGITEPAKVRELLQWIRSHAPVEWQAPRLFHLHVGDGGFIGDFAECDVIPISRKRVRRQYPYVGWEGWASRVLRFTCRRTKITEERPDGLPNDRVVYPLGSGPDLASLWALERAGQPASNRPSEIPYQDRWWQVGTQVLPWIGVSSWFNC